MNKIFKKLFFILLLANIYTYAQASELTQYFDNLDTLDATFTQTLYAGNNAPKQESKGFILVKSPDKFYLEYNKPYKLIYVADGKKLWSYDEDLEQVVVKEQGDLLVNTPAMLLSNPKSLTRLYKIDRTGETDGWIWFELTPKSQNSNFETVSLAFKDNHLKAMEMRDSFGQTTRLVFNKVDKNPVIDKNKFIFHPPKGVDVIGQ
jgi:outer membrane lipoprotein carrier protein